MPAVDPAVDPAVTGALIRLRLLDAGEPATFVPLAGGVSSDIWKVETAGRPAFCVKRALAKLKVAADWRAPVERSAYEAKWLAEARLHAPGAVPELLGYDEAARLIALRWYDPSVFKLWKSELRDGRADTAMARAVGAALAKIHGGTAGRADIAAAFDTDPIFHAIRLEPYLIAAGTHHPELRARLHWLVATTLATKRTLVHGDVSPKNILIGPDGPLFLDAECAWYGDPAFDLAFCLNHLALKCLWTPAATQNLLACFDAMAAAYLADVSWEPRETIEARAAHLLPGLFLARIDGKSPVEYVTAERDKDRVRLVARLFLLRPAETLAEIRAMWLEALRS